MTSYPVSGQEVTARIIGIYVDSAHVWVSKPLCFILSDIVTAPTPPPPSTTIIKRAPELIRKMTVFSMVKWGDKVRHNILTEARNIKDFTIKMTVKCIVKLQKSLAVKV